MIVVDSSVWIAELHNIEKPAVLKLRRAIAEEDILVGDMVLLEVLQGARDDRHALFLEKHLRRFTIVEMLDADLATRAARNYRFLRNRGVTIRKTIDMIIATYCIERGHSLLHDDRDFTPMVEHLGLQLV